MRLNQIRVTTFIQWRHRSTYDLVTGYRHKPIPPTANMTLQELREGGYILTPSQWLQVRRF